MDASEWLDDPKSLLDVGCNVGAWLLHCRALYPSARLAGLDVNADALEAARRKVPGVEFRQGSADRLPFPDDSFQYVTMLEVLEHVPAASRRAALREARRVLAPGGRLVLSVPHKGLFAWADSNNVRFRLPRLYGLLVGRGRRDAGVHAVEYHQHFRLGEVLALAGEGWRLAGCRRGGLLLYPLSDWLSWPFYRRGEGDHPVRRALERVARWDYAVDYGPLSYGMTVAMEKAGS